LGEWLLTFGMIVVPSSSRLNSARSILLALHYDPPKRRESLTKRHNGLFQKSWILNNTSERTPNFSNIQNSCMHHVFQSCAITNIPKVYTIKLEREWVLYDLQRWH
jgi:hypothetical protein